MRLSPLAVASHHEFILGNDPYFILAGLQRRTKRFAIMRYLRKPHHPYRGIFAMLHPRDILLPWSPTNRGRLSVGINGTIVQEVECAGPRPYPDRPILQNPTASTTPLHLMRHPHPIRPIGFSEAGNCIHGKHDHMPEILQPKTAAGSRRHFRIQGHLLPFTKY